MDWLQLARGPGLAFAVTVFILGVSWRLFAILRLPRKPDLSRARPGAPSPLVAAVRANARAMWPRKAFARTTLFITLNGYAFHIGLALVFLGYAPHIAFVQRHTGLSWPALPDAVMYLAAGVTIVSLLLALALRVTDAVRRQISRADDMISWTLTFLPLFTGMAVTSGPSDALLVRNHAIYGGALALHLFTLELLLVWFPFGKLMHAFLFALSRGASGVRFSHRGVRW